MDKTDIQYIDQAVCLSMARKGSDEWNKWRATIKGAVDFSNVDFGLRQNADINFRKFVFGDNAKFRGAIFRGSEWGFVFTEQDHLGSPEGSAYFRKAKFGKEPDFFGCYFEGAADFSEVSFEGGCEFESCTFMNIVVFEKSSFRFCSFNDSVFFREANFAYCNFDGYSNFMRCYFGAHMTFDGAIFRSDAVFFNSKCGYEINFDGAEFYGHADFSFRDDVAVSASLLLGKLKGEVSGQCYDLHVNSINGLEFDNEFPVGSLSECIFRQGADFSGRDFVETVHCNGSRFYFLNPPAFDRCSGLEHWDFHGISILPSPRSERGKFDHYVVDKYRRLRKIAADRHDHDLEVEFFAQERLAQQMVDFDHLRFGRYFIVWLYRYASDFGRSVTRPFLVWFGSLITAYFLYLRVAPFPASQTYWDEDIAIIAFSKSLPIIPGLGEAGKAATLRVFGGERDLQVSLLEVELLGAAQSVVALACLFLMALALRYYFKIRG